MCHVRNLPTWHMCHVSNLQTWHNATLANSIFFFENKKKEIIKKLEKKLYSYLPNINFILFIVLWRGTSPRHVGHSNPPLQIKSRSHSLHPQKFPYTELVTLDYLGLPYIAATVYEFIFYFFFFF